MRNQTSLVANILIKCAPAILANGEKKNSPGKPYRGKKHRFIKKRNQKKGSGRSFICGKKCHYAKQCKSKKKLLVKLLQLIQQDNFDDEIYTWSDSPLEAIFILDEYSGSTSEESSSTTSTDSNLENANFIIAVHDPLQIKLVMQLK